MVREAARVRGRDPIIGVILILGAAAHGRAQQPPPDGWVVIPVED
jgi:hypothetical protein